MNLNTIYILADQQTLGNPKVIIRGVINLSLSTLIHTFHQLLTLNPAYVHSTKFGLMDDFTQVQPWSVSKGVKIISKGMHVTPSSIYFIHGT